MSAFCEQCGAPLGDSANFCAVCGSKVPASTTADESSVAEKGKTPSTAEPPSASEPSTAERPLPFPPASKPTTSSAPPTAQGPGELDRKPHKRWPYVIAAVILIAIVIGVIAAVATGSKKASATVHKCSYYPDSKPKPQTCIASLAGAPCTSYDAQSKPNDCLSTGQIAARRKAKQRAAAEARAEAKRAAKQARAAAKRAAERAKRAAAARAAANAWHQGYNEQSGAVFWKWDNGGSCAAYAEYGCWHVVVITKYGCPSYVAVNANEYQGNAIVGQLLDNQGYGIPAKTPRVFELDADTAARVTAGNVSIDCE